MSTLVPTNVPSSASASRSLPSTLSRAVGYTVKRTQLLLLLLPGAILRRVPLCILLPLAAMIGLISLARSAFTTRG